MRSLLVSLRLSVLTITFATLSWTQVAPTANPNEPVVSFANVHALPTQHEGPASLASYLQSGQAQPLSLTHADFDGDGVEDLVVGYTGPGGEGMLSLRRGNVDAFAPQSEMSWTMLAHNQFVSPFGDTDTLIPVPTVPSFLASGQFLGQADLVTAAQGGKTLFILAGNGSGSFASPQSFSVPGPINAMASGRFSGDAQNNSLIIGTNGPYPSILVYRRSAKGVSLISTYPLLYPASSFEFDDLDGDGYPDAVMVSGGEVLILHSASSTGQPQLETLSLPFSAVAVVSGFFTHDRAWRRQMAVLDSDGTTHIIVHGEFDPRPWTKSEIVAMREALIKHLPNPFQTSKGGPASDGWRVLESFPGIPSLGAGSQPILLRTSFLGSGMDEALAVNPEARQASFISHEGILQAENGFVPGQQSLLSISSSPIAAIAMPVGAGQSGLVVLTPDSTAPLVAPPTTPITFTVNNTTTDTVDAKPGDGVCADASGQCSLRAAVMEANAETANAIANNSTPGPFKIMLPSAKIQLTIPGAATTDASTGHLDINAPVTIVGTGVTTTSITQTNPKGDQDMVFLIDAAEDLTPDFNVALSALAITGGHASSKNLLAQGGGIHWEAGADGTGQLALSSVEIERNYATDTADPGLDDGGGMALFNIASVTSPAIVKIGGPAPISNNAAFDAGGAIALRGAVSLTMTNITVSGNQAVGSGIQQGGGLFFAVSNNPPNGATSSPSYIHASTISSNIAGASGLGEGGGVWTDQTLSVDQGTLITGNSGGGAGGGISTDLQGTTDQVTITASTISGNQSPGGNGGGIEVDAGSKANLNLSFNRIFGNTVSGTGTGAGLNNLGSGTPSATDNWWGCNGGPQSSGDGCDQIAGTTTASPFVTLGISANPNPVLNLASTTLTAAFQDSNPNFSANLNALVNLPVVFSNPVNGTLSNQSSATGASASATATFTVSNGPTATANVQIDNATVTIPMPVSDFSLLATPAAQTVNVGTANATFQITVGAINGFDQVVQLTVGSSGLSATLNASQVTGSGNVTLTVSTASAAAGTYSIPVTGTCGAISHSLTVQLTIANFAISISPASQTVNNGTAAVFVVTASSSSGFTGPITLTSSGAPAGDATFAETLLNLSTSVTSASSNLTVKIPLGAYSSATQYSIVAQGTSQSGVVRSSSTATLVVNPTAHITYSTQSTPCTYSIPTPPYTETAYTQYYYQTWVFVDNNGAQHPFPTSIKTASWNGSTEYPYCQYPVGTPTTGSGTATDGSGNTISIINDIQATVTSPGGVQTRNY